MPVVRIPEISDGARMWQIAKDSQVLDANPSYAYLLWCRDFADTSVVVEVEGTVVGFVTGFIRPQDPTTVFVWQVAVDHDYRGQGLGVAMLEGLLENVVFAGGPHANQANDSAAPGVFALETTVSPDNPASIAMFAALARRHEAQMSKSSLFEADFFPDSHISEDLYRITPIAR